jgi:hypothetical protein
MLITVFFLLGYFIGKTRVNECHGISKEEFIKIDHTNDNPNNVYIDSANFELYHYVDSYFEVKESKLPDYYININNDTIQYNKENFFYYYSLYEITKHISDGKGLVISRFIENNVDSIN